jgi:hypothetical protein
MWTLARSHERTSEFYRGLGRFFALLGDEIEESSARWAAEMEQRQADREWSHVRELTWR